MQDKDTKKTDEKMSIEEYRVWLSGSLYESLSEKLRKLPKLQKGNNTALQQFIITAAANLWGSLNVDAAVAVEDEDDETYGGMGIMSFGRKCNITYNIVLHYALQYALQQECSVFMSFLTEFFPNETQAALIACDSVIAFSEKNPSFYNFQYKNSLSKIDYSYARQRILMSCHKNSAPLVNQSANKSTVEFLFNHDIKLAGIASSGALQTLEGLEKKIIESPLLGEHRHTSTRMFNAALSFFGQPPKSTATQTRLLQTLTETRIRVNRAQEVAYPQSADRETESEEPGLS